MAIRFIVGDKSVGVEIVSISDNQYHMVCSCDRPFSRGFGMTHIPTSCRACADDKSKPSDKTGMINREYTSTELELIKGFKAGIEAVCGGMEYLITLPHITYFITDEGISNHPTKQHYELCINGLGFSECLDIKRKAIPTAKLILEQEDLPEYLLNIYKLR